MVKKLKYNYHTHTYRCNHATGTEREYIERAISIGIKKLGFSEHIPFIYPHGKENTYRLKKVLEDEYISTLSSLREEYRDKIEIHIGYETEYYPKHFYDMVKSAKEAGAEYLILGQHSVGYDGIDLHWSVEETDDEEKLKEYADCVIAAMKSGYISYVAHPDIFNFSGDDKIFRREMKRICKTSKKTNIPLEINFLGIRENRHYPNEKFWEIAGGESCLTVFGLDAHDVFAAGDTQSLEYAEEIVEKYKLKLLDDPKLIRL
ncbi:MAG: histidinol-phosphatase [Clostridia bacterium]|nr:histidinol-phosphatase [Clostridia bacterium]